MSFNMAETTARITAQTEGQEKITALSGAVKDLSAEVKRLAAQSGETGNAAAQMAAAAQKSAKGHDDLGKSAGVAGHHMQNLAFQMNDVIVGLTSGQKPMTVFMLQGTQIGQIMAQAGVGLGGMVRAVGSMVTGFLAANPLLAAAGVVAGVAAAAIGLMAGEINKNSKVHVTWKDTALGAYDAIKDAIKKELTGAFEYFGVTTSDVWAKVLEYAKRTMNFLIGFGSAFLRVIMDTWRKIPAGVADIFLSAVNSGIRAINDLIAKSVQGINSFLAAANPILSKFGLAIPALSTPQISELENRYAGAGARLGNAVVTSFKDTFEKDYIGGIAGKISPFAQERARQRLAEDAKKGGGSAGRAAGKEAKDTFLEEYLKGAAEGLKAMYEWGRDFGKEFNRGMAENADTDLAAMREDMSKQNAARVQPGIDKVKEHYDSFGGGTERAFRDYGASIGTAGERAFETWNKAIKGTEDALVDFVMTGKLNFKNLANSIIADLVRIAIQKAIIGPLTKFLGGLFGDGAAFSAGSVVANANGNAFRNGSIEAFAGGGVVSRPTLFPMSGGRTGLMGEAGPEAIMPLRRTSNGRLGVEMAGGGAGAVNVSVNVDAGGTAVQGNGASANELGRAIGAAVQAELVKQKRPGGMLAA